MHLGVADDNDAPMEEDGVPVKIILPRKACLASAPKKAPPAKMPKKAPRGKSGKIAPPCVIPCSNKISM